jgi:hypothetical protein
MSRALAGTVSASGAGQDVDFVEMLLDGVDQQRGTMAGVVDLPGAAHARSFQGHPAKPVRYARLEVRAWAVVNPPTGFQTLPVAVPGGRKVSGYWPTPGLPAANPATPTDADVNAFLTNVRGAFTAAFTADPTLDNRLLRVQDHRRDAHPPSLGRSPDGSGPEQASYWVDMSSPDGDTMLKQLYRGAFDAQIVLPGTTAPFEVAGPRWYRPWSPQVVIQKANRSYRFGEDGRFEPGQAVHTRVSGETVTGLQVRGLPQAVASDLLDNAGPLSATTGLPGEVRSLVEEAMFFDSECGGVAAAQGVGTPDVVQNAIRGLWYLRDRAMNVDLRAKLLEKLQVVGIYPSPIAITPWADPTDPLLLDVTYTHMASSLQADWSLLPDQVDRSPIGPTATQPTVPGQVHVFDPGERARLTASLCNVLDGVLFKASTVDPNAGPHPVPSQAHPPGLESDTFSRLDLISAPLVQFDQRLFDAGLRERSGALRLAHLEVVDVFGFTRRWDSDVSPDTSPASSPPNDPSHPYPYWTALSPRLPYWSRLRHQFLSASNPNQDQVASPFDPVVCGFLIPNLVDHSVDVFDGSGRPIGELTTTRPQAPQGPLKPGGLTVDFHGFRWLGVSDDPDKAIASKGLRDVVVGLVAQKRDIPALLPDRSNQNTLAESALSAMLRVVDTIRSTLDPAGKIADRSVRLMGDPIVVVTTQLSIEATPLSSVELLTAGPPPLVASPTLPTVRVRVGDVTRPDDGVLGLFLPGASAEDSQFIPVSAEAVQKPVVSPLVEAGATLPSRIQDKFIPPRSSEVDVTVNAAKPPPLTLLLDARGSIYTTSGVLPRSKIDLSHSQIEAALSRIEATFRSSPLLTVASRSVETAAAPPIDLKGFQTSLIRPKADASFDELPFFESPPVGLLPQDRVAICKGRLRVSPRKPPS